jgi:hypothetical protein
MGLPGMDTEGAKTAPKRQGFEDLVKDLKKPEKVTRTAKSRWNAVIIQLAFGWAGGGYYYLEETSRTTASALVFLCGGGLVAYVAGNAGSLAAQTGLPTEYVNFANSALLAIVGLVYIGSAVDCYYMGLDAEARWKQRRGHEPGARRPPTAEEKLQRIFGEHDDRGGSGI